MVLASTFVCVAGLGGDGVKGHDNAERGAGTVWDASASRGGSRQCEVQDVLGLGARRSREGCWVGVGRDSVEKGAGISCVGRDSVESCAGMNWGLCQEVTTTSLGAGRDVWGATVSRGLSGRCGARRAGCDGVKRGAGTGWGATASRGDRDCVRLSGAERGAGLDLVTDSTGLGVHERASLCLEAGASLSLGGALEGTSVDDVASLSLSCGVTLHSSARASTVERVSASAVVTDSTRVHECQWGASLHVSHGDGPHSSARVTALECTGIDCGARLCLSLGDRQHSSALVLW
eukprot:3223439-Rhodomonas_salina.6